MGNLLPTKFLNSYCVSCGAYNVCNFVTAEECPTLRLLEGEQKEARKEQSKSRVETSLHRMERLLDEMEASTKRLAAIIERM